MSKAKPTWRDTVLEAAAADGTDPDGRLGRTMAALAALGDHFDGCCATTQALVDAQVKRADTALEQLRTAQKRAEAERDALKAATDKAIADLVAILADRVETAIAGAMVIREKAWERKVRAREWAAAGSVVLCLFLGGYSLRAWQDRDAVQLHARFQQTLLDGGRAR